MKQNASTELRPTVWDGVVALAVLVLAAVVAVCFYGGRDSGGPLRAVITERGAVVETVDLSRLDGEKTLCVQGEYTLTVTLTPEGAAVTSSDCPTQDCVHTGTVSRAGQSIVCLPAQVVITLEGTPDASAPDVIVG